MMTHISATLFAVAALAATLPGALAEAAEPARAVNRAVVRLGDLDLQQPQAAEVALTRIRKAAGQACRGGRASNPDLFGRSETFRRCRADVTARAVGRLDAPVVRQALEARRARPTELAGR